MDYTVYILESLLNQSYYIGQTSNVEKRLKEHNVGKSRSTKNGIPWKLVYKEVFSSRSEAMKREKKLKSLKKRKNIEVIIAG